MQERNDTAAKDVEAITIDSLSLAIEPIGPIEYIELTADQRARPLRRCKTNVGTEVVLALPRGTVIKPNSILLNSLDRTIIVQAALEDVLVVRPADQLQMCIIAHHLGNWHRAMQVTEDATLILEADAPLMTWLNHEGIEYDTARRPYDPNLRGAAHD